MNASSIPEPRLGTVKNHTPFMMFQCDKMGVGRKCSRHMDLCDMNVQTG